MTQAQLTKRVTELERQMQSVKQRLEKSPKAKNAEDFFGMFHGDADFKEAMEIGAAYRRSQRTRPAKGRTSRK